MTAGLNEAVSTTMANVTEVSIQKLFAIFQKNSNIMRSMMVFWRIEVTLTLIKA